MAAGTVIAILAITVLAADQLSKQYALAQLTEGEPVPVIGDALQWLLVFNPGAAFSMGEGITWVFTIALALVAGGIVFLAVRHVRSRLWAVVLGLLLGGVLGNLTDRLFRDPGFAVGHVVDFILTPWMWFWTTPAIYNVADIFIVGGMISVALLVVTGLNFDGTRGEQKPAEADDTDAVTETADTDAVTDEADGTDAVTRVSDETDAVTEAGDARDPRAEDASDAGPDPADVAPEVSGAHTSTRRAWRAAAVDDAASDPADDTTGERETRSGA